MLIVCSGADSYRSLEKVGLLVSAYKGKFDSVGSSVECLPSGKVGVEALLSACSAFSLFSSRRFFRADGLISACPKDKRKALLSVLSRDVDETIIVCLEDGDLTTKDLQGFLDLPKFTHYTFPYLSSGAFLAWATESAKKMNVTDARLIRIIADAAFGDSWRFVTELQKVSAGGESSLYQSTIPTVFSVVDSFLESAPSRRSMLRAFDDAGAFVSVAPGQVRSVLLARSGSAKGIHPFVAQKAQRLCIQNESERFRRIAEMFAWSRSGLASAEEVSDILF